jgi:undecaprenyl diphosphate synthase
MNLQPPPLKSVPQHVALIMDGNGRWAEAKGKSRIEGHQEGAQSVRAILRAAAATGIEVITVYAFSTENWKRPPKEIDGLMKLLIESLNTYEQELHDSQIRLRTMGQIERLPAPVRKRIEKTMSETNHYTKHTLVIALSYGARAEITHATQQIAQAVSNGTLQPAEINEDHITNHLYLPDLPDPELMIRTSGELRLSNFMLWQLSYAEIVVTDTFWPEFREPQFYEALQQYDRRKRRFGALDKNKGSS